MFMTIGENIRKRRKEKGLTQKKLGELCIPPIVESTIRRYELGKLNQKIADAIGVSVGDIYERSDYVEKNNGSKVIKIFIPHAELRVYVTDEMIKDYKYCMECAMRDPVPEEELLKQCRDCSWGDIHLFDDFGLCKIPALEEKMRELIEGHSKD